VLCLAAFFELNTAQIHKGVIPVERAICLLWDESELGWGIRPDGYSLHLNLEDCDAYVVDYWARMPREVPYAYSRPACDPYTCEVEEDVYAEIKASKNGIRSFNRQNPARC